MNDQLLTQFLSYQQQMTRNLMLNALINSPINRTMFSMLTVPNSNLFRPTFPLQYPGKIDPTTTLLSDPRLLMNTTFIKPESISLSANHTLKQVEVTPVENLQARVTQPSNDSTVESMAIKPKSAIKKLSSEEISSPDTKDEIASSPVSSLEEFSEYEEEADPSYHHKGTNKVQSAKKIKKKRNICGHTDRKHYAKGLCSLCYHKKSRDQKPKLCSHDKLYARDLCQKCYAAKYRSKENKIPEEIQN